MKKVYLPKTPGLVRVGKYRPDKTYEVSDEEAERLVNFKGFEYSDPPPPVADSPATMTEGVTE